MKVFSPNRLGPARFLRIVLLAAGMAGIVGPAGDPTLRAATKSVDLDGDGVAESSVSLNVLSTFPAKVECVVTNKAVGKSFSFDWMSAGPGGFNSSLGTGTSTGVGTKWTWQTSQSIYSYTGSLCSDDICFQPIVFAPGTSSGNRPGEGPGRQIVQLDGLSEPAPGRPEIPAHDPRGHSAVSGPLGVTSSASSPSPTTTTASTSDVGPFAVPGRSLSTSGVTVSTASLTSSLITFFSPPRVIFSATSSAGQQGSGQISFRTALASNADTYLTANLEPGPPGCCPNENQLNCSGTCVDYLSDPYNCGGCGVSCDIGAGEVCDAGTCRIVCPEGFDLCGQTCVNLSSDVNNCGACAHQCDLALLQYCQEGTCQDFCPVGQALCDGLCTDLATDASNCGSCGNACDSAMLEYCMEGSCQAFCPAGYTVCGGACADLTSDPLNCGSCAHACGSNQICSQSVCLSCTPPNQTACDNRCTNIHTDPLNCGYCGHNCNLECPSTGQGTCSQGNSCVCTSSATLAGAMSLEAVAASLPSPAPVCETAGSTITLPPGGSATLPCSSASYLAKELLTFVSVCNGGGTADASGTCPDGTPASRGPFIQLVPDTSRPVGTVPVALSPVAVTVIDPGGDGQWQPGETAQINITVGNAGSATLTGVCATLDSEPQDITPADGIDNPTVVNISGPTACYPDIPGTPSGTGDCNLPSLGAPVAALTPFTAGLDPQYLGDTSRRFVLHFTGTAGGAPFTEDVPVTLGIAGNCDPAAPNGGYDTLRGLDSPMAPLIPAEDPRPLPFPNQIFSLGKTRPLKLALGCGGLNLDDTAILAPRIVGLFDLTAGQWVDINVININDSPNAFDPFFRFSSTSGSWIYQMRTKDLLAHRYRLTIQVAGRKDYVSGFELQ